MYAVTLILFLVRMSMAITNHLPRHASTHSSSNFLARTSIQVSFDLSSFVSVSSNSQPMVKASSTAFDPRLAMNWAKSLFPSLFCSFAKARSSSQVHIRELQIGVFFAKRLTPNRRKSRDIFPAVFFVVVLHVLNV